MDQTTIDQFLTRIRAAGDAQMRPCRLVTPAMASIPAQRVGISHLFLRPRFVLADPTGSGKTPTTLAGFGYLFEKDPSFRLLVITTKSAQFQWRDRVRQFLDGVTVQVIGYEGTTKLSKAARLARYPLDADVLITTYATLTLDEQPLLASLDKFVLVFDEAHKINNFRTAKKTTKREDGTVVVGDHHYVSAQHASAKARYCWALTATPMKNDRLDELYSIFEVVRPGTFGPYSQFRRTYFVLKLVKPRWKIKGTNTPAKPFYEVIGTQNLDHLRATIDPFYLRRPVEVFGSLPTLTFERVHVDLDRKQRALYDEIIAQRWPGATTTMLKIAAIQYAQQVLGAPEVLGFTKVPSAKTTELVERLKARPDTKVLVYTKFEKIVTYLGRELTKAGIAYGRITGADTLKTREITRQRFQADPTFNVVLITDAGGEALDLQAARSIVFYDLPWSHGNFLQVIGRARRFGSAHGNVLAVLLGADSTIDDTIAAQLIRKETVIRDIIQQGNQDTDTLLSSTTQVNTPHFYPQLFS